MASWAGAPLSCTNLLLTTSSHFPSESKRCSVASLRTPSHSAMSSHMFSSTSALSDKADRRRSRSRGRRSQSGSRIVRAEKETYPGVYGPWSVETADRVEVLLYRAGLNIASFSLLAASLPALLSPPDTTSITTTSSLAPPLLQSLPLDAFFWTGTASLGISLLLIHIYVTPIKRTLQALWAAGTLGALILSSSVLTSSPASTPALDASSSLVLYVVDHPIAVWAVGPLFASLTGLVFKEGLCYGKLEAALLTFIIPTLLLGHLSGLLGTDGERVLLGAWVILSLVFALRKFTQPIKDDIGDKSVFMFQALSPEEQQVLVSQLNQKGDL